MNTSQGEAHRDSLTDVWRFMEDVHVWRVWRVGVVGLGVRAPRGGLSELIGAPFLEGLEFCCGCVRS